MPDFLAALKPASLDPEKGRLSSEIGLQEFLTRQTAQAGLPHYLAKRFVRRDENRAVHAQLCTNKVVVVVLYRPRKVLGYLDDKAPAVLDGVRIKTQSYTF